MLVSLFNVCSGIPISLDFKPCDSAQTNSIAKFIPRLNELENGVLILDRGYTGAGLYDLINREYKGYFDIQAASIANGKIRAFLSSVKKEDQLIFEGKNSKKEFVSNTFRVIHMESQKDDFSVLITNLEPGKASKTGVIQLYKNVGGLKQSTEPLSAPHTLKNSNRATSMVYCKNFTHMHLAEPLLNSSVANFPRKFKTKTHSNAWC